MLAKRRAQRRAVVLYLEFLGTPRRCLLGFVRGCAARRGGIGIGAKPCVSHILSLSGMGGGLSPKPRRCHSSRSRDSIPRGTRTASIPGGCGCRASLGLRVHGKRLGGRRCSQGQRKSRRGGHGAHAGCCGEISRLVLRTIAV